VVDSLQARPYVDTALISFALTQISEDSHLVNAMGCSPTYQRFEIVFRDCNAGHGSARYSWKNGGSSASQSATCKVVKMKVGVVPATNHACDLCLLL
jgi:hypothetical protein